MFLGFETLNLKIVRIEIIRTFRPLEIKSLDWAKPSEIQLLGAWTGRTPNLPTKIIPTC